MKHPKSKPSAAFIDEMLGEASWLLSNAQALADYQREVEAAAEWERAAVRAEQVASLLEADGQELEAAIQRVSAASCYEELGQYSRAVTLYRAALSAKLHDDYRNRVAQLVAGCLGQVSKELRRAIPRKTRKPSSAVP